MVSFIITQFFHIVTTSLKRKTGNTAQFAARALLEAYSVRLPENQRPYDGSMRTDYLFTLTKNLTVQSAHRNDVVLPMNNGANFV